MVLHLRAAEKAISKIKHPKCVRTHALNNAKIRMQDRPSQLRGELPTDLNMVPKKADVKLDTTKIKTTKMCIKGPAPKTQKIPKTQSPKKSIEQPSRTPGSKAPLVIKDTTPPELLQLSIEVATTPV